MNGLKKEKQRISYIIRATVSFSNKCRKINSIHQVKDGVNTHKIKTCRIRGFYKAHIKHYFTKSWEDWVYRFQVRGDLFPNHRKIEQFFEVNEDMSWYKQKLLEQVANTTYINAS